MQSHERTTDMPVLIFRPVWLVAILVTWGTIGLLIWAMWRLSG